jgi:hypothetical protein
MLQVHKVCHRKTPLLTQNSSLRSEITRIY